MRAAGRARAGAAFVAAFALAGCEWASGLIPNETPPAPESTRLVQGGDPARGRALIESGAYGCHGCHAIPQIAKARGVAGPPLSNLRQRAFIGGEWPNTPTVLVAFIVSAPSLAPGSGMPDVGVREPDARHIAAFLYSLDKP